VESRHTDYNYFTIITQVEELKKSNIKVFLYFSYCFFYMIFKIFLHYYTLSRLVSAGQVHILRIVMGKVKLFIILENKKIPQSEVCKIINKYR